MVVIACLLCLSIGVAAGKSILGQADGAPLPFCPECGRVLVTWDGVRMHVNASHPVYGCGIVRKVDGDE